MFKQILVTVLTFMICTAAWADVSPFSYSYLNVGYFNAEVLDEDFAGLGVSGSIEVGENFYLLASYGQLDSDDDYDLGLGPDEIEYREATIGAGFYLPIAELVDFVASLQYAEAEVDYAGLTVDGNGYLAAAGIRAMASDSVELNASVNYADIENEGETGYSIGGIYYFTNRIGFGLSYSSADDVDSFGAGFRFNF